MKKFIILILLYVSFLNAQSVFEFLKLNSSPRAEALGGTFLSNNDDVNVIFYNPAGINKLTGKPVSFSFLNYFSDIKLFSLAYSQEIEGIGRLAAGIKYLNYGDFVKADQNGNKLGDFGANDMAFMAGYSNELIENLLVGVNIGFVYSSISDYSSTGLFGDLGVQYLIPSQKITVGATINNLGTQLSTYNGLNESLPLNISLGVSKEMERIPLTLYLAFNYLNKDSDKITDNFKNFNAGAEIRLSKSFKMRLGYNNQKRKDLKIGTTSGLAGFNFGLGLNIKDYLLDYSFSSYGEVDSVHRFGISTSL